jgi:hypothetical protein
VARKLAVITQKSTGLMFVVMSGYCGRFGKRAGGFGRRFLPLENGPGKVLLTIGKATSKEP